MADQPVVHIGENSPEEVAYRLYCVIGYSENKTNSLGAPLETGGADRKYVLDTYAECLLTVRGKRRISS